MAHDDAHGHRSDENAPSHAVREHHAHAPRSVRFALVTVSDSRGPGADEGGDAAEAGLTARGHVVVDRTWVKDDVAEIRVRVEELLVDDGVDALVLTGGTGVAPRDVTPEAVTPVLDKALPGFGETFRRLSFDAVGPAAFASRALAGIASGKPVFVLPGSPHGVRLGVDRLIAPEAGHLVDVARREPRA